MNDEVLYEKNMETIREKYPRVYEKIGKSESEITVKDVQLRSGRNVLQVILADGTKLVMHSIYGESDRISEVVKSWGRLTPNMPFFFYGMTNYELMRRVYDELGEDCIIFVYEPSIEILKYYMHRIDFNEIFEAWPIHIEVGEYEEYEFEVHLSRILQIDTLSQLKIVVAPNYERLFGVNLKDTIASIKKKYTDLMVNWRTAELYTGVVGDNMLRNIYHMFHGYNVLQLKGMLKNEIPAIVVSAGPSLNKNITELKAAEGKACIIAVDTAIKPLLNHGIIPNFFVIVDGRKPTDLMSHPEVSKVPMVTCTVVAHGIMDLHKGKKFFYVSTEELEDTLWANCEKEAIHRETAFRTALATGGSVANTAFSLAKFMDASKIILVGQDLALVNDRTHADGTFQEKMDKASDEIIENTIWVEGVRGNKVRTPLDFARYLRWFEEIIKNNEMKNVIDATQGGAKIHGTKMMTLHKAIEKFCTKSFDVNGEIGKLPEMLDYAAKCEFAKEYMSLEADLEQVALNAEKAEKLYRKMLKLAEGKEDIDVQKLGKIYQKVTKLNDFMNKDKCALFVQATMMELNFTMRMGIYQGEEDEKEDLKVMAQHGITMNYYIKLSARYWKEQAKELTSERKIDMGKVDLYYPVDKLIKQLQEREV